MANKRNESTLYALVENWAGMIGGVWATTAATKRAAMSSMATGEGK